MLPRAVLASVCDAMRSVCKSLTCFVFRSFLIRKSKTCRHAVSRRRRSQADRVLFWLPSALAQQGIFYSRPHALAVLASVCDAMRSVCKSLTCFIFRSFLYLQVKDLHAVSRRRRSQADRVYFGCRTLWPSRGRSRFILAAEHFGPAGVFKAAPYPVGVRTGVDVFDDGDE